MKNWEQRNPDFATVSEIEESRLGNDIFIKDDEPFIKNLDEAVELAKVCIEEGMPITIVGDYDVDGITSSSILCLGLWEYTKVKPEVIIPKRMSEGYGLNISIIDRIPPNSLMITVDNGITAVEQIEYAKTKHITSIIIDHHQKRDDGIIPNADVVVDPSAEENDCYKHYCGAGLAYRFIKNLNPNSKALNYYITLAGIGTVTDVMVLRGHNRYLVMESLKNISLLNVPFGMGILLEQMNICSDVTENDYGFLIGPVFNAAGRLYDDGGQKFVNFITLDRRVLKTPTDLEVLEAEARQLIAINKERQEEVLQEMEIVKSKLQDTSPIIIMEDNQFKKGIVGIIAGKLTEKYGVPSLVFAEDTKNKDNLSGSGRSPEGLNLKEILDKVSYFFVGYGGHAGAAGMTIKKDNLLALENALKEELQNYIPEDQNVVYYDLDITDYTSEDMLKLYEEVRKYAPYGEGNQPIVFRYNGFTGVPTIMGGQKTHFKIEGAGMTALGFNLASEWLELGKPATIDVIGTLSVNIYKEKTTPQIEIVDFHKTEVEQTEVYNDLVSLFAF